MNGHHQDHAQSHAGAGNGPHQAAAQGAVDPVCGMTVDPATAKHQAEYNDRAFYFCSAHCRETFLAAPARYANANA